MVTKKIRKTVACRLIFVLVVLISTRGREHTRSKVTLFDDYFADLEILGHTLKWSRKPSRLASLAYTTQTHKQNAGKESP